MILPGLNFASKERTFGDLPIIGWSCASCHWLAAAWLAGCCVPQITRGQQTVSNTCEIRWHRKRNQTSDPASQPSGHQPTCRPARQPSQQAARQPTTQPAIPPPTQPQPLRHAARQPSQQPTSQASPQPARPTIRQLFFPTFPHVFFDVFSSVRQLFSLRIFC